MPIFKTNAPVSTVPATAPVSTVSEQTKYKEKYIKYKQKYMMLKQTIIYHN